jgi:hypothetical protein
LLEGSQEEQLRKLKSTGLLDTLQVNERTKNWFNKYNKRNLVKFVGFNVYFLIPQVPMYKIPLCTQILCHGNGFKIGFCFSFSF